MTKRLASLYKFPLTLLTDLYELTMAYGYWRANTHDHEAVFNLIFRKLPFGSGYAICAGLGTVIEFLQQFKFTDDDLAYLATLKNSQKKTIFPEDFLGFLKNLKFSCDIDAIEEGTVVFPQEPLIRVKGPLLQCQFLESAILNIINFQTLIATKASRVCYAARGEPVLEFGLRRAQGIDGALMASRAAFIGGCAATSNVLAGKLFGMPVGGTHAHSWIMSFPSELEAFQHYADALPQDCVLLVDTYNTIEGVKNAITVGNQLKKQGYKLAGIRLDSGDLAYLSKKAREMLDSAGFTDAVIVGSNDLDEHIIASLKDQEAKINVWGVGTKLVTAYNQPALDGVYKLTAMRESAKAKWQYKVKLSEQAAKTSTPGIQQVRRFYNGDKMMADAIYDELLGIKDGCEIIDPIDMTHRRRVASGTEYKDLLQPIFRKGKCVYNNADINKSREHAHQELHQLHESIRRFLNPHVYPVGLEEQLYGLRTDLILKARGYK